MVLLKSGVGADVEATMLAWLGFALGRCVAINDGQHCG